MEQHCGVVIDFDQWERRKIYCWIINTDSIYRYADYLFIIIIIIIITATKSYG
jgi:hypothetical protein